MSLLAWYDRNQRELPWRSDWASLKDPYRVWVSEVMLQQTLIPVVIPAYQKFVTKFPDLHALAAAEPADLREAVKGLGYYRRFGHLHQAARILAAQSTPDEGIKWPKSREEWRKLPGIGEYTSAAIGSIAFDWPLPVIDGNVERVLCRLNDIRKPPNLPELKPRYRELAAGMMAPWKDRPGDFNQAVMELGQRVCTPSKPDCNSCPLRAGCLAFQKNSQHLAPAPKLRPEFENVRLALMVPVRRRREGEFEVALVARGQDHKFLKESRGFWYTDGSFTPPAKSENAGSFNHNITRHKIHASVHVIDTKTFPALMAKENPDWIPAGEVEKELIASLDLKAWRLVKRHSLAPTL